MSYNQEYNEQPIYELDLQYSEDSESDTTILQDLYRCYLPYKKNLIEVYHWGPTQGSQW